MGSLSTKSLLQFDCKRIPLFPQMVDSFGWEQSQPIFFYALAP